MVSKDILPRLFLPLIFDNPVIYSAVERLRYSMVEADSLRSLIFIVASAMIMWAATSKFIKNWMAIAAISVLILSDLYTADKRYLNHDSFCTPALSTADPFPLSANDKAILADTAIHYRVMDIPRFYHPSPSYHHKAIGGYHAAKLTRYQDLIQQHLSKFTSGMSSEADNNILDMLNARYVIGLMVNSQSIAMLLAMHGLCQILSGLIHL